MNDEKRSDGKPQPRSNWRDVIVDEDDFRLACHLVLNWRKGSDGSDPELIDRIAAVITATRRAATSDLASSVSGHTQAREETR